MSEFKGSDLEILYLGAFTPDKPEYRNPATSVAGQLFQLNFLDALVRSECPTPTVHAYFPVASFPRVKKIFHGSRLEILGNGLKIRSLAHVNLGALKILTLGISAAWAAWRWARKHRAANRRVVVTYNLNAPPAFLLLPVCRRLGLEFVPFIGDIYVPGEVVRDSWLRRLEFRLQQRAIPGSDGLLVCNRAIVEDFAPGKRALLIEGGVPEKQVLAFPSRVSRHDAGFNVVFAGQLSDLNGVTLLLHAVKLLDMPNLRVTILGAGKHAGGVRAEVAKDARIRYTGLAPHKEVLNAYAEADLLLNLRLTRFDTERYVFPSKVIECLSTGRPLLSTATGHVESEFGEFVYLLLDETPEGLALKIREISEISPELRNARAAKARKFVIEHKTWEAQARNFLAYLRETGEAKCA